MRWKSGYSWERWFAWHPVYCREDNCRVWWETIERKKWSTGFYDYRLLDTDTFFKLPVSERYKRMSAGR